MDIFFQATFIPHCRFLHLRGCTLISQFSHSECLHDVRQLRCGRCHFEAFAGKGAWEEDDRQAAVASRIQYNTDLQPYEPPMAVLLHANIFTVPRWAGRVYKISCAQRFDYLTRLVFDGLLLFQRGTSQDLLQSPASGLKAWKRHFPTQIFWFFSSLSQAIF